MKSLPGPPAARPKLRPKPLAQRKLKPRAARPGTIRPVRNALGAVRDPLGAGPAVKAPQSKAMPRAAAVSLAPPAPVPALPAASNALILRGDYWEITYDGRSAIVEDCRGLRYIAILIEGAAAGGGPVHAKELVARASGESGAATELERREALLDSKARQQLLSRLEELAAERDGACACGDLEAAAALDGEHERITDELSRAASRGGRRRATFDDAGEKARKAVGKAISEAIARIASHPDLAGLAHQLSSTIRKGQWLSYSGPDWRVHAPLPRR